MTRLSYKNPSDKLTPLKKILSHTPNILDAFIKMEEAISEELSPQLLELTRLRIATNNECKFCQRLEMFSLSEDKRDFILQSSKKSVNLSEKEKLSLELVDQVMSYHGKISDDLFKGLEGNFTSQEIIALLFQIGHKNAGGWFNIAMLIE